MIALLLLALFAASIASFVHAIKSAPEQDSEWIGHYWPAKKGWYDVRLKCGTILYAFWDGHKWTDKNGFEIREGEIDEWLKVTERYV